MALPYKKLILGITGGIAAYKAAELLRLLVKQGIDVQVVMTEAACQFITPVTLQALSGKPVFTSMWDASIANGMPHIELSRGADAILIAPASADFLAKLVHGCADDLLSTLCLARECPLLVAPAMNRQMWENPATQRNIELLKQDGIRVLGPAEGEQACGETGLGRMLEPEDIIRLLEPSSGLLAGKRILITAGPTVEHIDPVRAITNLSSGKMGYSIAEAAAQMGAEVLLISGPVSLAPPAGIEVQSVISADDMLKAVLENIGRQDVFISVAAVSDYRVAQPSEQKLKKGAQTLSLELLPNTDILAKVASLPDAPFCVGFAAESENLLDYAEQKRRAKKLPLIAANLVSDSMGGDDTNLALLDDTGAHPLPRGPKTIVARQLLQHVATMLDKTSRKPKP
ncbi:MAG TPA: bifunctional phosphopantothenoylcysteine decarboxylase/phosphopantothenate--cysteine ligase CoaBC [Methylophilaceae bacterium]|nr:bifunctional phosphopantothenoylcysteine decarboxylase/phosphopantothenate--cysteine ligase CoaBC [Methylophilaceae bacterium]